ncbi:MAG: hypothetical protein QE271_12190 [Bacteriovoracaceae bacterium]|nr:hypothetical protein [Bacteriovoracaceae bacterium]
MGLLFQFPTSIDETDYVQWKKSDSSTDSIQIKSYGLPYIFWFYALGILVTLFLMGLAVKNPILQMLELNDPITKSLAISCLLILVISPIVIFSFFFYEKRLIANSRFLIIGHYFFGIPFVKKTYSEISLANQLNVRHFLSSPNYARMHQSLENQSFQNKGYFELVLNLSSEKQILLIDRSSRKSDLEALKQLLLLSVLSTAPKSGQQES